MDDIRKFVERYGTTQWVSGRQCGKANAVEMVRRFIERYGSHGK